MKSTKETIQRILRFISSLIHFILGHLSSKDSEESDKQQNG